MWRVLIVEDDPQMRQFFADSVLRCAELQLMQSLGTVADAKDWMDAQADRVDVLLIDLGLPDGSGIDVIRHAVRLNPACECLVISMFGDEDNVLASIEAGALGYIHKDSQPDDIARTILEMREGASPISPMIARRVLFKYREKKESVALVTEAPEIPQHSNLLSSREQEVLALIARGFSYSEIARSQNLSVHTVQTHIKNMYRKLAVHSKSAAVYEATRLGILQQHG